MAQQNNNELKDAVFKFLKETPNCASKSVNEICTALEQINSWNLAEMKEVVKQAKQEYLFKVSLGDENMTLPGSAVSSVGGGNNSRKRKLPDHPDDYNSSNINNKSETEVYRFSENQQQKKLDYVALTGQKRVSASIYKGRTLVNIREYWNDGGEMKPGKKGISLNLDDWKILKNNIDQVDSFISNAK